MRSIPFLHTAWRSKFRYLLKTQLHMCIHSHVTEDGVVMPTADITAGFITETIPGWPLCVCVRLFIENYTPNTHTCIHTVFKCLLISVLHHPWWPLCVCMCVWGLQRRLRQDQVSLYKKNQRKSTTIITDRNNMYCNEAMVILIIWEIILWRL